MFEVKVKVGKKGQILIPKKFRDRYGVEEGGQAVMEPTVDGLLIKGRPSPSEMMDRLKKTCGGGSGEWGSWLKAGRTQESLP